MNANQAFDNDCPKMPEPPAGQLMNGSASRDLPWEYTHYLHLLTEVQKAGIDVTAEIKETVAELHKLIFKP